MSLIIYPTTNYDSFVSQVDADSYISKYSPHIVLWTALDSDNKDMYLRIATDRILSVVDETVLEEDVCLSKACAMMAIKDLAFGISANINPNTGLVSKEKVGELEVSYYHGNSMSRVNGIDRNPFPSNVIPCLNNYGANLTSSSIKTMTIERS